MSGRRMARSAMFGVAASAVWLAGASLPTSAATAGPAVGGPFDASGVAAIPEVTVEAPAVVSPGGAGTGADFVATAGLKRYAMSNRQLNTVRGGFNLPGGVSMSFGFQQQTSVNGTVVQSILVPVTQIANGIKIPVYVTGQTSWTSSFTPSQQPNMWLQGSGKTITVSSTANSGQTVINTTLGAGIVNSIANTVNGPMTINQTTTMDINLSGLAQSIAAEQAVNSVFNSVTRSIRAP
jgi:hypothetical protein